MSKNVTRAVSLVNETRKLEGILETFGEGEPPLNARCIVNRRDFNVNLNQKYATSEEQN